MTKICHMTSAHSSQDVRIFHKECISLQKAGYQTYLVASGENRIEQNVVVCGVGDLFNSRLKRMLLLTRKVYRRALELNADIYHIHDPELLPFAIKLKKRGKIVIFDSHENILKQIEEKAYIPKHLRKIANKCFSDFYAKAFKKMDAIITVDPLIGKEYEVFSHEVVIVSNYPCYQETYKKIDHNNDIFTICFAGGISPQWNHETVIRAIEPIENIRYIICGKGNNFYMNQLKCISGWDKVDYQGVVNHDAALRLLSESDMGIALCSYSKNTNGKIGTLGNTKLFEIMMLSLPLLCTDFDVWKDIVETNKCGICISPTDVEAVRAGITFYINNKIEAGKMGKRGKKAVENLYNWEKENEKLLKLYQKLESRIR